MPEVLFLFVAPLFFLGIATGNRLYSAWRPIPKLQFHLSDLISGSLLMGVSLLILQLKLHDLCAIDPFRSGFLVLSAILIAAWLFVGKVWRLTTKNYSDPRPSPLYMVIALGCGVAVEVACAICYVIYALAHWKNFSG